MVDVREENTDTLEIAHELQEALVNNDFSVIVYAQKKWDISTCPDQDKISDDFVEKEKKE